MRRLMPVVVAVIVLGGAAFAEETASRLRVKVQGEQEFVHVQLKANVNWTQVRTAEAAVQVGSVTIPGHGKLAVLCKGQNIKCGGKDVDGNILKMESEFSDECTCGPNGDGPCQGDPPGACDPPPPPENEAVGAETSGGS